MNRPEVVTDGAATGAGGTLTLWMLDNSGNENSSKSFSHLPGRSNWTPVSTCTTATGAHDTLRIEIYPKPGGPTLGVDAVDLRVSSTYFHGTKLTVEAPSKLSPGTTTVTVAARLRDSVSAAALSETTVNLYRRSSSTARWTKVCTRATSAVGTATVKVRQTRTTQYQWRFSGSLAHGASENTRWVHG